ncbi:hypothetical protein BDY19DRAFT_995062 [Irpex rosettiformis]|uniref:Uncharacterized protein n=1 Tax=Irpex rosettiformis TaxID=378272 RepID=A0ACB8TZP9_9APHY|nr:hypothetical protein BDY19DRAFT_995062 [Irpex rosettiformis]
MADTLPPELGDRVIDFLHDDSRALSACSLTCRSWLPVARYHRWSHTRLERSRLLEFVGLLVDAPDLASFISRLDFYDSSGSIRRRMGTLRICQPDEFDLVLKVLPNLRSLHLEYWLILEEVAEIAAANPTFCALDELALLNCDVETLDTAAKLMAIPYPSLNSICLSAIQLKDAENPGTQDKSPWIPALEHRPAAKKLLLSGLYATEVMSLFEWISGSVTSLQIVIQNENDAPIVGAMLSSVGHALIELDLVVDTDNSLQAVFHESGFSLTGLPALRHCSLTFNLREMFVPGNISLPWISTFLQELSSNYLDTIILKLRADDLEDLRALDSECGVREIHPVLFDDLEALDWTSLESSTATGRLPSLKRIIVEGRGNSLRFLSLIHVMHKPLKPLLQLRTLQ